MVVNPTRLPHDPSTTLGSIATAAATTVGLVFIFLAFYFFVAGAIVVSPKKPNDMYAPGAADSWWRENQRHQERVALFQKGSLLVSPVLAASYSSVIAVLSAGPPHPVIPRNESWLLVCILASMLISLPFAAAALTRQRSLRLGWDRQWAIFVLVFGPFGWVAYRVHRRWPPVSKCEQCGSSVPQHLADCLVCGEGFLPPAPNGTEVFA